MAPLSGLAVWQGSLLLTRRFGRAAAHVNAGYGYDRSRETAQVWRFSWAVEAPLARRVKALADLGVERGDGSGPDPVFALGGLVMSPAGWLDFDVGVKRGLTRPEEDLTFLVGTALRF